MSKTRPQHIIIFSAGESERNGNLGIVKDYLKQHNHICYGWRELFANANDSDKIALLPMLLKKIPSFDFAIILSDGVDSLNEFRGKTLSNQEKERIMRDNVLFETGLCTMALGADRVILMIENHIRIPEDLNGIGVGNIGVKNITYANEISGDLYSKLEDVLNHIDKQAERISPIVIGAAVSTADGYVNNFILRFWENIWKGFVNQETKEPILPVPDRITMNILMPKQIDASLGQKIQKYYSNNNLCRGIIQQGQFRGVDFRYTVDSDGNMNVYDIPSTVTASYGTVCDILNLTADEKEHDTDAEKRFLQKELDSFRFTLGKLLNEDLIRAKEKKFKKSEEEIQQILNGVNKIHIVDVNL